MSFVTSKPPAAIRRCRARPLMFEPEARWAYGGSIDRVGRLVEIASGQDIWIAISAITSRARSA